MIKLILGAFLESHYYTRDMTPKTPLCTYDIAIIGGGINGAGVARECALRGISCVLLEKNDFGSGTSSKSSKLAHGGLRYLENGDFRLVFEACHERERLLKNSPHLVRSLPFIIPIYRTSRRPKWQIKIGLTAYDFLSGSRKIRPHRMLDKEEVIAAIPQINRDQLMGGALYYDAQMDDARLVIENILDAEKMGAHVYNYAGVTHVQARGSHIDYIEASDQFSGETFKIHADCYINTTGPWSDEWCLAHFTDHSPQLRLSKGVHIIVPFLGIKDALLLTSGDDGRVFFVIPWFGMSLIGTTDTDYSGSLDEVSVTEEDESYLLRAANRHLSGISLTSSDIIHRFAGLRPLIRENAKHASKVSREHTVTKKGNMLSLCGGKYTTFRKMSEDITRYACDIIQWKEPFTSLSKERPVWGGNIGDIDTYIKTHLSHAISTYGVSSSTVSHLINYYGSQYTNVLSLLSENPAFSELIANTSHLIAEFVYAKRFEKAKTLDDFLRRRTRIALSQTREALSLIASQLDQLTFA